MAVNNTTKGTTSLGRRLFWGTNVTLAVLLVVFLAIVVNVLANKYNVHKDLSGGLTGHRLSDRTKRVLDEVAKAGTEITISTVYTSNDPERNHKEYLPKLRDFCDEVARYQRGIKIEHISAPDDQAELRDRVSKKFGSATSTNREATDQALVVWEKLKGTLDEQRKALDALMGGASWLKSFSSLAGQSGAIRNLAKNLEDTTREVKELVEGEGMLPRYSEANPKITSFDDEAKRVLQELQSWARNMDKLAKVLSDPNTEFLKTTQSRNEEIAGMLKLLQGAVGDPSDTNVPDDPVPVLKKFGDLAKPLADLLNEELNRVDAFVKQYPTMNHYSKWIMEIQDPRIGLTQIAPLSETLNLAARTLTSQVQQVRTELAQQAPKDVLQRRVRSTREVSAVCAQYLSLWMQNSVAPFTEAAQIDEASKQFLAAAGGEDAFKDLFKDLDDVGTKIKGLPEQKMDEVGKRLEEDNIIVVESDKEVRILPFDDVWPLVDRRAGEFSSRDTDKPQRNRREFNGDSAIANALLDMQNEKPFATVIFVSYETQPPPQMRQFGQRPTTGPLPMEEFRLLRERLERANFAVREWNLAPESSGPDQQTSTAVPEPPAPEEGTEPIYVLLPPPEQPPISMFGPQGKPFGDAELKKVGEAIKKPGAKAIFLALGSPRPPGAPPSTYAYADMLKTDWGIQVEHRHRVMRAVPSAKEPGMYSFDPIQFHYMRLNHFTEQPIGKPLRSRRMLFLHACPVIPAEQIPEDVVVEPVLLVPEKAQDMWAEGDFAPIIKALRERSKDTMFAKSSDVKEPPFPVIVAAENKKTNSRVVVMGTGASLLENYLEAAVPRIDAKGEVRLVTDPPPTENVELFTNALYWLGGKTELIAAGPADVPIVGPIAEASKQRLWGITMGWALAVLVIGGAVMFIRRR
ncbi:MAG TPA: hypothetical protein PKG54_03905 [Phycisphaerae bacterium]|nr:hypothetical protein [Phycisphaerae bacterium]HOB73648.1 hypothetical protein [Phycisphaerae bacterium]HOJ54747.1 hypothetical protein [Phycisphaerae bacterium]HOL25901.1 hypothetical protein [Phycisphaerae bacterium]HPP21167.1 hypothetical protein [Phycisphaerae bacterium]